MSLIYLGTGKPALKLVDSSDNTKLEIASTDWLHAPTYNRIFFNKLEETYVMANGKKRRFRNGVRVSGEIFFDIGTLSQTIVDKLILFNNYDGSDSYSVQISPRSDGGYYADYDMVLKVPLATPFNCILDVELSYKDDFVSSGVTALIRWEQETSSNL